ncbi:MAG: CD1871A family CXXC motif-containing protein [Eubacteriales bacterium]|nr:CD1871A family CXXC motif-containing protein [Eubacteriales bacterium]
MKRSFLKSRSAAVALLLIGIVGVLLGLSMGEEHVVLQKAIRICMECIGLG